MKNSIKNVVVSGILTVTIGVFAVGCSKSSEQVKADETLASATTQAPEQTRVAKADSANLGAGSSGRAR